VVPREVALKNAGSFRNLLIPGVIPQKISGSWIDKESLYMRISASRKAVKKEAFQNQQIAVIPPVPPHPNIEKIYRV